MSGVVDLSKLLGGKIAENSPTILSSLAVVGVISTAVLAVQATPKAIYLIEQERIHHERARISGRVQIQCEELREGSPELQVLPDLGKWDIVKLTYKCYIPTVAVGLGTICCIVRSNAISQRRIAAIAGAYTLAESAFREYQSRVIDTIGRGKELRIRDEIAASRIKENPASSSEVLVTGKGECLCYDGQTGRYFKSSVETIRQAVNNLNERLLREDYVTLNEAFFELGLASIKTGDQLGWHIDKGLIEVEFSTQLSDENEPCLVLDYKLVPKYLK